MDWINVNDRLPATNQKVLFYIPERDEIYSGVYTRKFSTGHMVFIESFSDYWFEDEVITHWMPMPKQPERLNPEDCVAGGGKVISDSPNSMET